MILKKTMEDSKDLKIRYKKGRGKMSKLRRKSRALIRVGYSLSSQIMSRELC